MVRLKAFEMKDAAFICRVRNTPELQRWFRQDKDLTLKKQKQFLLSNEAKLYNGYVILNDKEYVGVCNKNFQTGEFGIAVLPEYQKKGIATQTMRLLDQIFPNRLTWSEVFIDNPALSWYLRKCGFKAVSVKERAYYKKNVGLIDVVRIEKCR